MGADIKTLRTRIKSVDSTLHLTKAMGLVASSKLRRAQEGMLKGREYAEALTHTVRELAAFRECEKSPYMKTNSGGKTVLAVIAGDRGLAGGYNANIFRLMREYPDAEVIPIGKRACDRYGKEPLYAEDFTYQNARAIALSVLSGYAKGEIKAFGIVSTKYHSMMSQEATLSWVLPLAKSEKSSTVSAIFEPDALTVLDLALPEYLAGILVAAVRESFASEIAARRVAMDSAGKNAEEMIAELNLAYNRARQGAITQEITEIVAGSGL